MSAENATPPENQPEEVNPSQDNPPIPNATPPGASESSALPADNQAATPSNNEPSNTSSDGILPVIPAATPPDGISTVILPPGPIFTFPPIAGFWRRLAAAILDGLVLGVAGQIIGWPLSSFWFQIGPYGRLVGLVIMLAYFGIMNSSIGKGQTLGKRVLKIAVRDKDNRPISIGRSLLRTAILVLPGIFNGWSLPAFQNYFLAWIVGVIVFGVGLALIYTIIFNRRTRQGIHDLIAGTYVVKPEGAAIEAFPVSSRTPWIVSGVLVGLVAVASIALIFLMPSITSGIPLANLSRYQQILNKDDRFHNFYVGDNTSSFRSASNPEQNSVTRTLVVDGWYKGSPDKAECERLQTEIARIILLNADNLDQYDRIKIGVASRFDLGISTGHISFNDSQPASVWRDRVNAQATK